MSVSELLGSAFEVRRRSTLAGPALARRAPERRSARGSAGPARGDGGATIVRTGRADASDVKALDDEIGALHARIKSAAEAGGTGMTSLFSSHLLFTNEWREFLTDMGFDENLKLPWYYATDVLKSDSEAKFIDFRARERNFGDRYAHLKTGAPLPKEEEPSFGKPLPPPKPGTPTTLSPGTDPRAEIGDGVPPEPIAVRGSSAGTLVVLLVASAAAIAGYLLLRRI